MLILSKYTFLPIAICRCCCTFVLNLATKARIMLSKKILKFTKECINILKLSVHGCESYIRNLIKLLKLIHDQITDKRTGYFLRIKRKDLSLDAVDHPRDLLSGD